MPKPSAFHQLLTRYRDALKLHGFREPQLTKVLKLVKAAAQSMGYSVAAGNQRSSKKWKGTALRDGHTRVLEQLRDLAKRAPKARQRKAAKVRR
ncbi:MAG: hypothetical protein HOP28_13855 [Gemmatimonadales bacterium]|nr:hypothetical protein [Gemmatimonadales bacterium]